MQILWNRLLVETQVLVSYRHSAMAQMVYYLFPSMQEAEKQIRRLKTQDAGVQVETIQFKTVRDVFTDVP